MVKVKLLRRRRARKVSVHKKVNSKKQVSSSVRNMRLREVWQRTRSVPENLRALGIAAVADAKANTAAADKVRAAAAGESEGKGKEERKQDQEQDRFVQEEREAAARRKNRRKAERRPMTEAEQQYIVRLIRKHGENNVEAMFWDLRLNFKQKTKKELARSLKRYQELTDEQRLVSIS